ncbi:MAG: S8 family serine peptidase, partial [Prevotella sp.]|nr:S8 family serine peptidase [Prevotella sp.]
MELRKIILLYVAIHFCLLCFSQTRIQSRDVRRITGKVYLISNGNQYEICENVVLAKLKEGKKQAKDDIRLIKSHPFGMLEIAVPDSIAVEEYINILDNTNDFEYVEYDTYIKTCMSANDNYYYNQWGPLHIHAEDAWNITTGSPSVKVAVIDCDGFEYNHPDLNYGSDSYSNISVSDGINYVSPNDSTPEDKHGTMVAGIICAKTNNWTGIAGIAGGNNSAGSKIIPYCISKTSHVICAINDAVTKGVKVINMSIGCSEGFFINQAITDAYNNGVTLVCSSGNDSSSQICYPASHTLTIAVGSINSSDMRDPDSNYGNGLDLVAPGVGIWSTATAHDNYYKFGYGTSFAAPHVSGVVALMLSVNSSLTPYKIRNILNSTASKIKPNIYLYNSSGWNDTVGYGLIDAHKAVLNSLYISGPSIPCDNSVYSISNLPSSYTVTWSWQNPYGPVLKLGTSDESNGLRIPDDPPSLLPVLQQNTPSTNMCTLNKNGNDYIKNTIVAAIKKNGTTVCTLTKSVDTGRNFSGFYSQAAHQFTNWYYPGTSMAYFGSGNTLYLYRGSTITLTSSKFVGATLSYSGTTPVGWTHSGNTVSFYFSFTDINDPDSPRYTQNPANLIITGTYPNSCECFEFTVIGQIPQNYTMMSGDSPIIGLNISSSSSQVYTITCGAVDGWELSVIDSATGETVYRSHVEGAEKTLHTAGWKSGIYIVKATVGDLVQ